MDTVSISPRTLYSRFGSPRSPLVLDVRRIAAFEKDPRLLPAATRPDGDLAGFAHAHSAGRALVTYCVHGHEVSREAARTLSRPGGSRWITRERPKIDRVACPWLIQRFIDPLARFDYVPTQRVFEEAARREAVPYDIPGAVVTHRAERCSFDALIEDFALHDPALDLLASIVRGADTDRLDLAPQCAGLVATSLGLSKRFADDHEMLANALPVYDGLYAWCRAQCEADTERHTGSPVA